MTLTDTTLMRGGLRVALSTIARAHADLAADAAAPDKAVLELERAGKHLRDAMESIRVYQARTVKGKK